MNDIKVIVPLSISHLKQFQLNAYFLKKFNTNVSIIASSQTIDILKDEHPEFDYINETNLGIDIKLIEDFFKNNAGSTKRMGWYLQQFIKLNYAMYYDGDYISFDADTIQLKDIQYKKDDRYLFNMKTEHNELYFITLKQLLGNLVFAKQSFIAEYMIFNSEYVKDLLNKLKNKTADTWYMNVLNNVGHNQYGLKATLNGCGFSEFETYGTFMLNWHADKILMNNINTMRYGKTFFGHIPTYDELISKKLPYHTISFENW